MSLEFLRRNLGLKILSLILAIVIWSYVKYSASPQAQLSSETKLRVSISQEGLSKNLVVLDIPASVTITVKASPEVLSKLDGEDFKAFVDLSRKKEGLYNLQVKVNAPPQVVVSHIDPDVVSLRLDPLEKRIFPVKIKPSGTVAQGFILGEMKAQPENVTVLGAQSLVSKVKEVQAVCDVNKEETDLVQRVALEIIDENGSVIEELKSEPAFVRASISLLSEVTSINLPVSVNIKGAPAAGFSIKSIQVDPPSVTVRYRYDLENPPKLVKTSSVSVEGAKSGVSVDSNIIVPQGVTLVENETARVRVKIGK